MFCVLYCYAVNTIDPAFRDLITNVNDVLALRSFRQFIHKIKDNIIQHIPTAPFTAITHIYNNNFENFQKNGICWYGL